MNNEIIPYVTRNLRHLLAAPNLTETQRTIITRTLATLSEVSAKQFPEHVAERPSIDDMLADEGFMRKVSEEFHVTTDDELAAEYDRKEAEHNELLELTYASLTGTLFEGGR